MSVTTLTAIWGAALSTILGLLEVLRFVRDRSEIKVETSLKKMHPDPTQRTYLVVTITNVGRHPVLINSMSMSMKKGNEPPYFWHVPRNLPKMISPEEQVTEYSHDLAPLNDNLKSIYVEDSRGRRWKAGRHELRNLIAQAKKEGIN